MLEFCKMLHDDIKAHLDEWSNWLMDENTDIENVKETLTHKLDRLADLMAEKAKFFEPSYA